MNTYRAFEEDEDLEYFISKYNLKRDKYYLESRLNEGYVLESLIITNTKLKGKKYKVDGQELTLKELCKESGVKYKTFLNRLKSNKKYTIKEALDPIKKVEYNLNFERFEKYEYKGIKGTKSYICDELDVTIDVVTSLLNEGIEFKEAIERAIEIKGVTLERRDKRKYLVNKGFKESEIKKISMPKIDEIIKKAKKEGLSIDGIKEIIEYKGKNSSLNRDIKRISTENKIKERTIRRRISLGINEVNYEKYKKRKKISEVIIKDKQYTIKELIKKHKKSYYLVRIRALNGFYESDFLVDDREILCICNRKYIYENEEKTIRELAIKYKVDYGDIIHYLLKDWEIKDVMSLLINGENDQLKFDKDKMIAILI